jgi:hypothetical protein
MGQKDNRTASGQTPDQGSDNRLALSAESPIGNRIQSSAVRPHRFTPEERLFRVSIVAYQKAAQRDFEPGAELDDWLAAEREIDAIEGLSSR